ncbi:MAG: hypothetical protein ACOCP8_01745 [archaeon]
MDKRSKILEIAKNIDIMTNINTNVVLSILEKGIDLQDIIDEYNLDKKTALSIFYCGMDLKDEIN